jgi:glycosyltransferase involved in cell wall biosynthesis
MYGWQADTQGCGTIRLQLPLAALAERGHHTYASTFVADEWADDADLIIGQRICRPEPTGRWQKLASTPNRPTLVFDIDDDLWHVDPSNTNSHRWFSQPQIQDNLIRNIQVSDLVTVTTERLAEIIRQWNPNVAVLPNYLPASLLDHQPERRTDTTTVGWSGSDTHAMDFLGVAQELVQFIKWSPTTEYHSMGNVFGSLAALPRDRMRLTPWVDSVEQFWRRIDFHIGIVPLKRHVFNSSKSPLKALELAFLGIPAIASNVGPYPGLVRHGETGYLVRKPGEWGRYLRKLVNDEAMRDEMGHAARKLATEWTIEGNIHRWEDALLRGRI